jgi:UDP-glucose 4-epimerase
MKTILTTGGAGYIGSHTCVELLAAGLDVVIVDNLHNSKKEAIKRIEDITGKKPVFYQSDILNRRDLQTIFKKHKIDAVVHFAGLKAVGESVAKPLDYYWNNVAGTLVLLDVMKEYSVKTMVFSSSATVYGAPKSVPIKEDFPLGPTNPYGRTKLMIEDILKDLFKSDPQWSIALLRYFNPVGAHPSGLIGEDPNGIPNNLFPYIAQVAVGKLKAVSVFGNDYPTKDGTGVRDYIHVVDLAKGHLKAIEALQKEPHRLVTCNLGTGRGYSVLEALKAFEKASGKKIPYRIVARRPGDVAECFADPSLALAVLNWKAEKGLDEMCRDHWNWQSKNPDGYK